MTLSGTARFAPLGFTHTFSGNWVNGLTTSVTPVGTLIFNGANAQISGGGTLATAELRIASGATVESFIAMSTTTLMVVQTGGILTLNGTVSGTGAFTVEAGATLGIRSAAGIAAAAASGNVQTSGVRTFSSDATYRYNNNSGNPQVTGSGLPATVRNLVADNPQGVTLTSVVSVSEDLTLSAGSLSNPGATVTVTVLPVVSGTLTIGQTLSTTNGTWAGAPTFTYQWQRCSPGCADIDGATADTYIIDAADDGARLRALVTATDRGTLTVGSARTSAIGGGAPPPPPPDVEPLSPDLRGKITLKEQLAAHREQEACISCHRKIDPMGLPLENFDPIGRWRDTYPKIDKDAKTTLPVDTSSTLSNGREVKDLTDFKAMLLERESQVAHCLTEKLMIYATGRLLEASDRGEIDRIISELKMKDNRLRDLVHLIVQSEIFLNK